MIVGVIAWHEGAKAGVRIARRVSAGPEMLLAQNGAHQLPRQACSGLRGGACSLEESGLTTLRIRRSQIEAEGCLRPGLFLAAGSSAPDNLAIIFHGKNPDDAFCAPALQVLRDLCRTRRDTPQLSDEDFLRGGLQRILGQCDSGRDFLRVRRDRGEELARSTWFDALHSIRRATMVAEVATRSYASFERSLRSRDWLAEFPELADRAVWAVDGHHLEHARHAARDRKGEFLSVGFLSGLCLHTGLQRSLVPFQVDGVRHHEWPVFKQQLPHWLRQDRRIRMPIVGGDPAYLDVVHWAEQKRLRQALIITREKENMKPMVISQYAYDPADPVHRGIEADEMAGDTSAYLRRIVSCDPASGERFVFLTTEDSLRPGVIALLYLLRWKIEKVFAVFKNKPHQQKAWANGATAAATQAHLTALTHNLLTLLLVTLERAGISEKKTKSAQTARRTARETARARAG